METQRLDKVSADIEDALTQIQKQDIIGGIKSSVEQRKQELRDQYEILTLKEDAIEDEHERLEKVRK